MMKLKSVKSIMNLSKRAIVMAINDQFRKMSKKQVALIYYALLKAKLPTLKATKQLTLQEIQKERKRFDERMAPRLKPKRTSKQKRADKKNGDRLKKWMKDNR